MYAAPVLQSGFVTFANKDLQKPDPSIPNLRQEVLYQAVKNPLMKYHFSKEVGELYSRWSANPASLKDFDFRQRILKAAFNLFHNSSFVEWVRFQNDKPTFSDLHKSFLIETLSYLASNKPRKIENILWVRLLEASEKTSTVRIDINEYFYEFKGTELSVPEQAITDSVGDFDHAKLPRKFEDVIQIWTSKERGFEDLLICLHVIFGNRFNSADINEVAA